MRGPLTIGDMVAWNAAIGPSYKGGRWGYLDLTKAPHTAMVNPVTGFPVKYSQQHEDFQLAAGRGMPAPFDNGVMRFAWVAPLVTNWMGDHGFLKRLYVQVKRPRTLRRSRYLHRDGHLQERGRKFDHREHYRRHRGRQGVDRRRGGGGTAGVGSPACGT